MGIGMGEQGIARDNDEARRILQDAHFPADGTTIEFEVKDLTIHMLSEDAAVLSGKDVVTTAPSDKEPMCSGLMQTLRPSRG